MHTIRIPIELNNEDKLKITDIQRIYSSCFRYAFNRFRKENLSQKEVRSLCKDKFQSQLGSWLTQNAIIEATYLHFKKLTDAPIFGGRLQFSKYLKKLISKDELKSSRLMPILSQGEKSKNGNRLFEFDLMNNCIIFKLNRLNHFKIQLPKLKKNYKRQLKKIYELSSLKQIPFSVKLTTNYISITYELPIVESKPTNRILGIDQNPDYIGLSILEFKNDKSITIYKQVYDLKNLSSKDNKMKNIRHYELTIIAKKIVNVARNFNCSKIAIEDLNFKSSFTSKAANRKCKRDWCRTKFTQALKKQCNLQSIELVEVNAAYSSFIGNVLHGNKTTPDMIAASIEIGRRGYKKFTKGWFYPKLDARSLDEQWKQTLDGCLTWKEAFNKIKNSKVKYRVSLEVDKASRVFSLFHNIQSYIFI